MIAIYYFGIDQKSTELVNSKEFRSVLAAHPNLRLVTVAEDDDYNETFDELDLPLPEGYDACIAVVERDNEDEFMWVLYDNHESVIDPSPAFVEVLLVMDAFSQKTLNRRLFITKNMDLYSNSPEILAAEYDFAAGDYIL